MKQLITGFNVMEYKVNVAADNLRLKITFADPLPRSINILIYAEIDNIIDITNNRNIQMDYT